MHSIIYLAILFIAKVIDNAINTTKTITITAYPETKAESRLINEYIEKSQMKFKRVVQPG